jgi:hypothetical protein
MTAEPLDGEFLDGCGDDGVLGSETPLEDDHSDLFVLFAEGLDPNNPKTVSEAEAEWRELFNEGQ